ncbi:phosphotransferase family protein [Nocardia sp. NPDC052278]|uniref:phosphotransferase family protein n=1 Tax=unclassified Nocardia TaxID=2637762 RepID=UPI0036937952
MTVDLDAPFSDTTARRALELAGTRLGVATDDAQLIRMGENAIYALPPADVVARIARSEQRRARVEKELAVARWLARHDFPAVRVAEQFEQLIPADGRLITFWQLVDITGEPTEVELAALLRDFHTLPEPEFPLPTFDPFSAVPARLANPGNADPTAIEFLTELYYTLRTRYAELELTTPHTVIHGDAHINNIIPTPPGPILSDFEAVARGPREWDLTTVAMTVDRFGLPRTTYQAFADTYGYDVTGIPGYPVLCAVRELTMVTWLMQIIDVSPQHAQEFAHRVDSLRSGDQQQRWHIF